MRIRARNTAGADPIHHQLEPKGATPTVMSDRYERFDLIPWFDRQVVHNAKVLVIGAGALGNETIKNLALFGVGRIAVCDFDVVELSNLSRSLLFTENDIGMNKAHAAVHGIRRINPHVSVTPLELNILGEVGTAFFREFDVVIGAVDSREGRLAINRACWKVNRPFVDGALDVLSGVVRVFVPPDSACYECTLWEDDMAQMSRRDSCGRLVHEAALAGHVPTTPVSAAVIGALQVQETLKILHPGADIRRLCGEGYVFDGQRYDPMLLHFGRKPDDECDSHIRYEDWLMHPGSRQSVTVGDLVEWIGDVQGMQCDDLVLERDILVSLLCDECGLEQQINRPESLFRTGSEKCPSCEGTNLRAADTRRVIVAREMCQEATWADVGIPPMDIVTARKGESVLRVAFANDKRELLPDSFC